MVWPMLCFVPIELTFCLSMLCTIQYFCLETFSYYWFLVVWRCDPFDVLSQLSFCLSMICPVRRFVFQHFVLRRLSWILIFLQYRMEYWWKVLLIILSNRVNWLWFELRTLSSGKIWNFTVPKNKKTFFVFFILLFYTDSIPKIRFSSIIDYSQIIDF